MLSPNCGVKNKQCKREKTVRKECWLPWMGWLFGYLTNGKPSKQHFLLHFIITLYHILCTFAITSDTQLHVRTICSRLRPGQWLRLMITSGQHRNVWTFQVIKLV